MIIYYFNNQGIYSGNANIKDSEPWPENSVSVPPPALSGPQAAKVNANRTGWDIIEDYRGHPVVDAGGTPVTVDAPGPLPDGWRWVTPIEEVRAAAMETLRLRKWQAKDAGITVNGIAIDTDDRGQATISGAVTNVILDPTFTATWKTNAVDEHGQSIWIVLDATMIVGLSKALTAYTEACFGVEAMKQSEVAALSTVADIQDWLETSLDTGWPDQTMTLGV